MQSTFILINSIDFENFIKNIKIKKMAAVTVAALDIQFFGYWTRTKGSTRRLGPTPLFLFLRPGNALLWRLSLEVLGLETSGFSGAPEKANGELLEVGGGPGEVD